MSKTWAGEPGAKELSRQERRSTRICALYLQQMGLCYFCGDGMTLQRGRENTATVEHLTARAKGGKSKPDNLAASCKCCNSDKATLSASEYFARLGQDAHKRAAAIIDATMSGMPLPAEAQARIPAVVKKFRHP